MGSRALALAFAIGCTAGVGAAEVKVEVVLREGTNFAAARSGTDGSFVLDLQGTLWRLAPDGGEATALTDGLGDDRLPHFSSDGTRLVFQSYRTGTWDIWTIASDGSNLSALTESRFDDREPVLSPDGTRVAFSSDRSGNYDIWILDLDTEELTQFTTHEANDYMPVWSPSGKAIAFVTERVASGAALYRSNFSEAGSGSEPGEGTAPVEIAVFDGPIASPSWSPDGSRIALRQLEIGTASADAMGPAPVASRLLLVPAEGGEPVAISTPDDVFPFRAEWNGDDEIIYSAAGALWRHELEADAEPQRIPFEAKVSLDRTPYARRKVEIESEENVPVRGILRPVLAPDGSRIAFAALGDIWLVEPTGGKPVPLTRDEYLDSDPHWSPDSRSLVFSSDRGGSMDLWIKRVDQPARAEGRRLTLALGAELSPAWSPDGMRIAYLDERSRLHVMTVSGDSDETLTEPRRGVSQPTWSNDSRHVAMTVHVPISTRFREGYNRILVVDTRLGSSRLLDQPDRSIGVRDSDGPVWSPDGKTMAFAMDGGLWVMSVATDGTPMGAPRQIVGEAIDFPSWSGDSASVYFVTPRGIKRVDAEGGRPVIVPLDLEYQIAGAGGELLIRDVRIIDGTGAPPLDHQDVLIQGNRIDSIRPTGEIVSEDLRIAEGNGRTLIPGLIEMHTHLSLPMWGSRHGKVWLSYGVTSMRTPSDALYRVLEERESIRAGRRAGPRVFFTGGSMDGDRIYYTGAYAIADEEELAQEMQRAFDLEFDLIKTYVRLPDSLQKLAIEEAHRQGVYVTSHEIYPALAYGIDGLEHIQGTSRRGYSPKLSDLRRSYDDVIELIARSGVYFTPTVLIYGGWSLALAKEPTMFDDRRFNLLFPPWAKVPFREAPLPDDREGSEEVMAPIFDTIDAVADRGGRIIAGTDSPIIPYGLSLLVEIEELSGAGLGPLEAIRSATGRAAEALGASDAIGTIEEGKIADLVLLGEDPMQDIRNLRSTEVVIVNGRLLTVEQLLRNP